MDFSVIRCGRKKKSEPPPPKESPPPPPPPPQHGPLSPYMEELGRLERLKSIEYANCYRLNFDEYPNQQFGSYHHYPVGGGGAYNHNHNHNHGHHHPMLAGLPPQRALPPPQLGLPQPDCLYGSPHMALTQPDYHHAPPGLLGRPPLDSHYGPPPNGQYYSPPPCNYGGYFSDENPNGCMIM